MATGIIHWYNDQKGYGFIKTHDDTVFLPRAALKAPKEPIKAGLPVEFDIEMGNKGPKATDVNLI